MENRTTRKIMLRKMRHFGTTYPQLGHIFYKPLNLIHVICTKIYIIFLIKEQLYQEQLRQHEAILIEAQKTSHNHAQALTKLEVLNENNRKSEATGDMLKMELAKAKVKYVTFLDFT